MPALHDSDVTVQPTAARGSSRFDKMHGDLCALRVSQQFRYENCPQMIEKELWLPTDSPDLMALHVCGDDTRSYFAIFFRSPKQFLN